MGAALRLASNFSNSLKHHRSQLFELHDEYIWGPHFLPLSQPEAGIDRAQNRRNQCFVARYDGAMIIRHADISKRCQTSFRSLVKTLILQPCSSRRQMSDRGR
jgi:hypothetical protein